MGNLEARRDFTDVRDVARAYIQLAELGRAGEIYNVGSGTARSIGSVLEALCRRARADVRIEVDPARLRPVETPALVADASRLFHQTGWRPQTPFETTVDDLLEFWRTEVQGGFASRL